MKSKDELMHQEYNKLVRDRIPAIIRQSGYECGIAILSESDYSQALRNKLLEEAQEAASSSSQDLVKELADLYEVIDTLIATSGITHDDVLAEQERRRVERGGFDQRIQLLWTELPDQ